MHRVSDKSQIEVEAGGERAQHGQYDRDHEYHHRHENFTVQKSIRAVQPSLMREKSIGGGTGPINRLNFAAMPPGSRDKSKSSPR